MPVRYLGKGMEGPADVGLATGIAARQIAATVGAIATSGYAVAGSGAGHYVSDALANAALAAAHPRFCKQSLDGRYWRLLPQPWISVRQGGAVGDGIADDHAAIQAAINYGQSLAGATIYFPAATYKVGTSPLISSAKGLNLLGEGPDRSIISAGAMPAMKTLGYWRSSVEGLQFQCNANPTGGAFELEGKADGSFGVQQIQFRNCMFHGSYNSKYAFTNQRIAAGNGQGSECSWIGCAFQGAGHNAGDALFMQNGNNAVQNTLIGCNFQGFITGVLLLAGNIDVLHCGFQSAYGYEQISAAGWDVDASAGSVGDTLTMTGCRSESLRIFKGGGPPADVSNFGQEVAAALSWPASTAVSLNDIRRGTTPAGNIKLYRATAAGTTAATAPIWPESGTASDGSVVWTQLEFNVIEDLIGNSRLCNGQVKYGRIKPLHNNNVPARIDSVSVTRDDCFPPDVFIANGEGPLCSNVRLKDTGNDNRPVTFGNNNNAGARNVERNFTNFGNHAAVWTAGDGGGTYHDLLIKRGGGDYNSKAPNWFEVTGGWGFDHITFAQAIAISRNGVVYYITDGVPGSSPLSGSGGGTLAVRQNGVWQSLAVGAGGGGGGGGGSPGGSSGDIQYNSAGAFAGAANVRISGGNLALASTTIPSAPTGGVMLYSQSLASRHMPMVAEPSGIDAVLQAGFQGKVVFMAAHNSPSSNALTVFGGSLTGSFSSQSSPQTIGSADRWQATIRKSVSSNATAGTLTGYRSNSAQWYRGNNSAAPGFFFRAQFGMGSNNNGTQTFHGLCASTSSLPTGAGAVGALLNMVGMGFDTTDANTGNWFLYRNDASGAATKVDLGADAARNANDGYDLIIYCPPGAATEVFVRVFNISTQTVVLDTSYTTDLPAVNVGMAYKGEANNGAAAVTCNVQVARIYIESD